MDEIWNTKHGRRRVRRDPPTLEEAVIAAQGLTDEVGEQTEIVASLMHVSADEARRAVLRMVPRQTDHITVASRGRLGQPASARAVIVERRGPRRPQQGWSKRFG